MSIQVSPLICSTPPGVFIREKFIIIAFFVTLFVHFFIATFIHFITAIDTLHAWIIDKDAVLRYSHEILPCANSCDLCQRACKTCSLSAPYMMNPLRCVSFINSYGGGILPKGVEEGDLGNWVYGCDDCQDSCPHNKNAWTDEIEFPGLMELENYLIPRNLAVADDSILDKKVQPKLWYIPKNRLSQYRENAQRVLRMQEKSHCIE